MRPHHTVSELSKSQPILVTPLPGAGAQARERRRRRTLTRATFYFAWLFGLEPFLTGTGDDAPRRGVGRR
ncbi:hypothetical protein VOM14_29375 [Paraburkholderia sp. MPAMCS5]|uniref:hypothetical protein n=1 Tax=Paraburkholderia sp. MPAMCS5 TaxID=3112563 RepID=UPI002E1769E9|nr:hypothetical protein [Paraburkholderia sp. MPAMCS5]